MEIIVLAIAIVSMTMLYVQSVIFDHIRRLENQNDLLSARIRDIETTFERQV